MTNSFGVVLLSGPSGSGKSYIAHRIGLPVLRLDDFYKNGDDVTLPQSNGRVDWESPQAWDAVAAVETISQLAHNGHAQVPIYAIGADRRVGGRRLDLHGSSVFVAEGIFAAEIVPECRRLGLLVGAYALHRPRAITFTRRLVRDLRERRKPPGVLIRRGLALLRAEPAVLRRQTALGCHPASGAEIVRRVSALAATELRRRPGGEFEPAAGREPATATAMPAASRKPA